LFQSLTADIFQRRTGIDLLKVYPQKIDNVVSLRDIRIILNVQAMPLSYLEKMLIKVGLEDRPQEKIYYHCNIQLIRFDPWNVKIGQTFIERTKYQSLLEDFPNYFEGYCITRGAAKCNAYIVIGMTENSKLLSLAHYVPPIIEENNGELVLLDGVHRSFLIKNVGTTSEAVLIKGVKAKFPCDPQDWRKIKVVDSKPPRNERYFNLNTKYFRDLKYSGIDG